MIRNPGETFSLGRIEPVHFPVVHPDELPSIDGSMPLLDMTVGPDGAEVVQTLVKMGVTASRGTMVSGLEVIRLESPDSPTKGRGDNEVVADKLALPFADESFGTVVTSCATHGNRFDLHSNPEGAENRHRLESEIMRVLRFGGFWIAHEEITWDSGFYPQRPVEGKTTVSANMRMGQIKPGVVASRIILAAYRRGEAREDDTAVVDPATSEPERPQPPQVDQVLRFKVPGRAGAAAVVTAASI